MTREEILAVVKKHLSDTVDDVDVATLDVTQSMKDLGANSLDMVEVVSRTMRELKIKIPRTELAKLTSIEGLVELLYVSQESATEPSSR